MVDLAAPSVPTAAAAAESPRSLRAGIIGFCRRQPLGTVGLVVVMVMAAAGLSAEWIAPYSPTSNNFAAMTEAPSWAHLMGTDQFGRDLFSRIIFGAQRTRALRRGSRGRNIGGREIDHGASSRQAKRMRGSSHA